MSTPVIAFFNNKGGVGKTSLVYHLAWMYAEGAHVKAVQGAYQDFKDLALKIAERTGVSLP